jgi:hypothetical protein
LLGPLGIQTQIDVGKNLQEQVSRCFQLWLIDAYWNLQTMNSLGAIVVSSFDKGGEGPSNAIAYPNIYQLFGSQASTKVAQIQGNLTAWATSQAASALSADALH